MTDYRSTLQRLREMDREPLVRTIGELEADKERLIEENRRLRAALDKAANTIARVCVPRITEMGENVQ